MANSRARLRLISAIISGVLLAASGNHAAVGNILPGSLAPYAEPANAVPSVPAPEVTVESFALQLEIEPVKEVPSVLDSDPELFIGLAAAQVADAQIPMPEISELDTAAYSTDLLATDPTGLFTTTIESENIFQTVGATWPQTSAAPDIQIRVRATDGQWAAWTPLVAADDGKYPAEYPTEIRAGSRSVFVGDANAVQVALADTQADSENSASDVSLVLVGSPLPDFEAITAANSVANVNGIVPETLTGNAVQSPAGATLSTMHPPRIITRSEWGARAPGWYGQPATPDNPRLPDGRPTTSTWSFAPALRVAVVHHTANANTVTTPAQALQQIRNDQAYHMNPASQGGKGWDDIGYNFIVDPWGNIFEGAAGSIEGAVVGAHVTGFNTGSVGVALLGDFSDPTEQDSTNKPGSPPVIPTDAALQAAGSIIGWRLAADQISALGDITLTVGVTNNKFQIGAQVPVTNITAHRFLDATACPGNQLFARLDVIRNAADYWQRTTPLFPDVPRGSSFVQEINWLKGSGITTGNDDGTFNPDGSVNRMAMAAFLFRAAGEPVDFQIPTTPTFVDVPTNHRFFREIEWLAQSGVTNGWDCGEVASNCAVTLADTSEFRPGTPINRGAIAAFLYRFHGEPEYVGTASFPDATAFVREISWLAASRITTGYADGTFRPMSPVTRAAMAAFLYRGANNVGGGLWNLGS